ncbi:LOW QUALITY PROTEIN: hypothetical protein U0070_014959, partial [Myodes glareolus]
MEKAFLIQHSPGPRGTYCMVSGEAQVGRTPQDTQASQRISFKMKKVESLLIALCNSPHSTTFVSGNSSAIERLRFLGKPCRTCLREVVIEDSSPSLGSLLLVSSLSDIERTPRPFPSGAVHEPSQALHTQSEIKPPSETLQRKFTDTPSLNGTVLEQEKETQEVLLLTRRTSVQNPGAHSHQAKSVSEFPQSVEKESTKHPRSTLLPVNTLAFQELSDIVMSLVQQKPSTPRHEVSLKSQIQVLAPTYQSEETKRQSKEKHEEMSKLNRVKEKDEKFRSKHYQALPKPAQVPPESLFQKILSHFLQWIHPMPTIKGQESPPKKVRLKAATAQSQRKQVKKKPCEDNNVAEAQELMTAIEQLSSNSTGILFHFFPQTSYGHKTVSYSEQRRAPSHPANSYCQKYSTKERHIKDQPSQNNEAQTPQHPRLLIPNKTLKIVCSAQNGAIVPMVSSCHLCCPRHCTVQRSICSQLENSSLVFTHKKAKSREQKNIFHVKNLGPILGKISKDQNSSLEKSPVKLQEANLLESEHNLFKSLKKGSRSDSTKHINKTRRHPESSCGRKSEQINQHLLPLSGEKPSRCSRPQKNLFKMKKGESLPVVLCDSPPSTTSVSGTSSAVEGGSFLGKPCQTCLREAVIEDSSPSLGSLPLVSSLSDIERTLRPFPSGADHEPSQVLPTQSEIKPSPETLHCCAPSRDFQELNLLDIVMVGGGGGRARCSRSPVKKSMKKKLAEDPPESPFQKLVSPFLQWIHPMQTIKGQLSSPMKGKPTAATAQSQQKQVKKKPCEDNNVAEAQELMTAVGQVLGKNMMQQRQIAQGYSFTSPLHLPMAISQFPSQRKEEHPATQPIPTAKSILQKKGTSKTNHLRKMSDLSRKHRPPQHPRLLPPNKTLTLFQWFQVLEQERESQEVLFLTRRTSVQNPGAHSHQAKTVSEFPQSVEKESTSQPQGYTTAVILPQHPRTTLLPVDTLASQELGDIVMVGGAKSLVQQKPSTPKHQVSPKSQIQVLAPTYQGEETKRKSKEKHEEESMHNRLKKNTNLEENTITPFQKPHCFLQKAPSKNLNVAEAVEFMTAVEQLLEKNMMQQRKLCASKLKQHRDVLHPSTPQSSYCHRPVFYSEKSGAPSPPPNSYCKERHIQDQQSQKNVQFIKEAQTPQHPSLLPLNTTLNLVHSSQHGAIVPMVSGNHNREDKKLIPGKEFGTYSRKISKDSNRYLEKISSKVTRGKSFGVRNTHQALKEHIVWFQVKHSWGEPLKILKPINKNLFKIKKVESLPIALCDSPPSTIFVSGSSSAVEVVRFLGKPCQTCLREVVIEYSSPLLGSLPCLLSFLHITSEWDCLRTRERETKEVLLLPIMTSVQNPEAYSHQAKTVSEFPQSVEKESASQPQ